MSALLEFYHSTRKTIIIIAQTDKIFVDWILSLLDIIKTEKCGRGDPSKL